MLKLHTFVVQLKNKVIMICHIINLCYSLVLQKMSKRQRKGKGVASSQPVEEPTWGKHTRLSEVRAEWQPALYKERLHKNKEPFICERTVIADWEKYGVFEPFRNWGWMAALEPITKRIYDQERDQNTVFHNEIIQWMSTLVRTGTHNDPFSMALTGTVNETPVTLSMDKFNEIAGDYFEYDTGVLTAGISYSYPADFILFADGTRSAHWAMMIRTLFHVPDNVNIEAYKLLRQELRPLPRALSLIIDHNILPRSSDLKAVRNYQVPLLYALVTNERAYSLRHMMMMRIWACRDQKDSSAVIPFTRFLSALLRHEGVISGQIRGRNERIMPLKLKVTQLYFRRQGNSYIMEDLVKGDEFVWAAGNEETEHGENSGDEDSDAEMADQPSMGHGYGQGHGRGRGRGHIWDPFQQEMLNRQEEQYRVARDLQLGQLRMQEIYRQQDFEYAERVRHHNDFIAGRPLSPVYHPVNYSQLTRPADVQPPESFTPPPYPGLPTPMFYRDPPPPPPSEEGGSSHVRGSYPWDMGTVAQGLFESLFQYPPPDQP